MPRSILILCGTVCRFSPPIVSSPSVIVTPGFGYSPGYSSGGVMVAPRVDTFTPVLISVISMWFLFYMATNVMRSSSVLTNQSNGRWNRIAHVY